MHLVSMIQEIKIDDYIDKDDVLYGILNDGMKRGGRGTSVRVFFDENQSFIYVSMVKNRNYHRIEIDIETTGYKISRQGRRDLAVLIQQAGQPDVREPEREFVNTCVLDIEVQREDKRLRGEMNVLHLLLRLLEEPGVIEKQTKGSLPQ